MCMPALRHHVTACASEVDFVSSAMCPDAVQEWTLTWTYAERIRKRAL